MSRSNDPRIITYSHFDAGFGTSFLATQLTCYLLHQGARVSTIDLTLKPKSLTYYLQQRKLYNQTHQTNLPEPHHIAFSLHNSASLQQQSEQIFFTLIQQAAKESDYIIIDTPDISTELSILAHAYAHQIITPIPPQSELLKAFQSLTLEKITAQSSSEPYFRFIGQVIEQRLQLHAQIPQWFLIVEPLSQSPLPLPFHSQDNMFHYCQGLKERHFFQELFELGLSLSDTEQLPKQVSYMAARQELRELINDLQIYQPLYL